MNISESLKGKINKSIAEKRFVGMTLYSEDEYQSLLAYTAQNSCAYALGVNSYLYGDDNVHFVTLVEIAKRWKLSSDDNYDDQGFWNFVYSTLDIKDGKNKLYGAFTDLIKNNGLLKSNAVKTKKYYATIMMHAFAPNKSMNAFFDFVYNIYKKDLDFNYTEPDKDICDMATQGFCSVVQKLGEKNDVTIGSGAYGIKIGLRCMALGADTQRDFAELVHQSLTAINLLFHGEELPTTNYVFTLIKIWWDNKSEKDATTSHTKHDTATTKQNITIKFIRQNNEAFLRIPSIRFASGEAPRLWLTIYDATNAIIESQGIRTRIGEITITSVQQDFSLNGLLSSSQKLNLRVEISDNGCILFKNTIKKDFIIFDDEKEVTSNILKPNNYFVYSTSINELQLPESIYTIGRNLYNIYPIDGEILRGSERQVMFVEDVDTSKKIEKVQLLGASNNCRWLFNGVSHQVFATKISLLVSDDISTNSLELRINNDKLLMASLTYVSEEGYNVFDLSDMIVPLSSCNLSIYSHLKEKELLNESVLLIPKLNIAFSQRFYYGDDERKIKFSIGSQSKNLTWNLGDNELNCNFCKGELRITIPQFRWRIDAGDWHFKPIENIVWYKKYFNNGSIIEIKAPSNMDNVAMYCLCDGIINEVPTNASRKFEIGKYIYSNDNKRNLLFFLKSISSDKRMKLLATTTTERFLQIPPLEIQDNKAIFSGDKCFVGDIRPYYNLSFKCIGMKDVELKSTELTNGILDNISEGIYWVKISAPSSGLFGAKKTVLWEGEFVFGDREKLKLSNLIFKINPICGITIGNWKGSLNGYYISQLIRLDEDNTYFAKLYYTNSNNEQSDVCGYTECKIVVISPIALQLRVKDMSGNFSVLLKGDNRGNIFEPNTPNKLAITNYNFIEVKNV